MPNSKKPRKAKKASCRSIPLTIRHTPEAEMGLQLAPHAELMKFREGYATEESWHTLVARLNVGFVAAQQNQKPTDVFATGLEAMLKVKARNEKTGKWALSGNDYKDISDGLLAADNLQLSLTRKQFAKAIDYVFANAAY